MSSITTAHTAAPVTTGSGHRISASGGGDALGSVPPAMAKRNFWRNSSKYRASFITRKKRNNSILSTGSGGHTKLGGHRPHTQSSSPSPTITTPKGSSHNISLEGRKKSASHQVFTFDDESTPSSSEHSTQVTPKNNTSTALNPQSADIKFKPIITNGPAPKNVGWSLPPNLVPSSSKPSSKRNIESRSNYHGSSNAKPASKSGNLPVGGRYSMGQNPLINPRKDSICISAIAKLPNPAAFNRSAAPSSSPIRESLSAADAAEADRKLSIASSSSEGHGEDIIVTPYAQILATLQNIRNNFIALNKIPREKIRKASTASNSASAAQSGLTLNSDESVQNLAVDTLSELDWCLNQLENIQTHRSVSEMASTKFKKMMNDELSHLSLNDKEGNEVTKYLTTNFLDKDREDPEVPGDEVTTPLSPTRPSPFYPASRSVNNKPAVAPSSQLSHPYDEDTCKISALPNHFPPTSKVLQRGQTVPNCFCTCSKQLTPPGPFLSSHTLSQSSPPYPVTDATIMPSRFPTFVHHSVDEEDDTETRSHSSDHPASTAARYSTATSRYLHRHSAHHATVHGTSPQGSKTFNVMSSIMGFNPICIHIHSFRAGIPRYGVKVVDEHALGEQISQVDKWGMDIFKLHEVSHHRPLTSLTYTILKKRGLISTFDIPVPNLLNFLMCVEDHYLDIPYHNRIHATDVTQSSHILLSSAAFKNCFNELEQLAIIIASAIHDVDHPGYTNQFLINSCSDLALIYNDSSVLENHHLAIAFKILQEPKCDIFANVSSKKKGIIRRLIIDLVLATDMSKHMKLLADLKTMVETRKISGTGESQYDFAEKNRVLQAMIHCGDLSNPTKPLDIYLKWTSLIMEEYFLQGEKEKQCGLQVSPMCDRETASIDKTQIGFMDYIVQPLWETWADLVHPDCQPMLNNLEKNREYFEGILHERECEKQKSSLPTTTSPMPETTKLGRGHT